jgi:hypothetical protein
MGKIPLTKETEFVVGQEKVLNYVMGCIFLVLFLYGLIDPIKHQFKNIDYQSIVFVLALAAAIYCFKGAQSRRVYIRVNKRGIYQDEKLVTNWPELIKVYISQKEKTGLINLLDNFILVLEYRKDLAKTGFRRKIPLTNFQNKSEEEVLEAVNYFWSLYKKEAFI